MDLITDFMAYYKYLMAVLVFIIITVFYLNPKPLNRGKFIVLVSGFLVISTVFDFFMAWWFVLAWLAFHGVEVWTGRAFNISLLILLLFLEPYSFPFILLAIAIHISVFASFVAAAFNKM
ncbi:hypothetical protein KJ660_03400 [Candidatus Micrarchaeota archaeon]|nr:hypothetical protein [Candidatus Micrarchaeota archaeon]